MSTTTRNTVITLAGNVSTLLLGVGVIASVGARFGVGREMDAFWAASTLPNVLGQLFLSVALLILVPLFIRRRAEAGESPAWESGTRFLAWALALGAGLTLLLFLAAPLVVRILAPGLDPETGRLAARLLRVLCWSVAALAATGTISALLIAQHRFTVAALARPLALLCVLALLWAGPRSGPVDAYAWAVTLGSLASALLAAAALAPYRTRLRWAGGWRTPALAGVAAALPMVLAGRVLDHGNQVVTRAIASALPIGAISALGYAWTLFQVPGILGASVGTVVYPQFSEKAARGMNEEVVRQVARCCRLMLLVSVPLGMMFLVLAEPMARLLFERGMFQRDSSLLTARVIAGFAPGVLATSINALIGNLYWSMGLLRTRLLLEGSAIALCVACSLLLAPALGAPGLALSTSLMYLALSLGGIAVLRRWHLPVPQWAGLLPALGRTLVCGGLMAAGMAAALRGLGGGESSPLAALAVCGGLGLAVYLASGLILIRSDIADLWQCGRRMVTGARPIPLPSGGGAAPRVEMMGTGR